LSNVKLGRIIEKILGKKDKNKMEIEKKRSDQPISSVTAYHPSTSQVSARPERIYIKARVLQSLEDLDEVKNEVSTGNIIIVRLGPLAKKSTDDVKIAVSELCDFVQQIGGDIARLGEERIVVTPHFVRIWREKTT